MLFLLEKALLSQHVPAFLLIFFSLSFSLSCCMILSIYSYKVATIDCPHVLCNKLLIEKINK